MKRIKVRKPASRKLWTPLLGLALIGSFAVLARAQAPQTQPVILPGATPELAGRIVEDIHIFGNTSVSNTLIRNLVRTQIGDKFDPITVQQDYQRIYDLKKFANVEATVEPTRSGGVIVSFIVTEQKLITKITFRGNRAINSKDLSNDVDLKEGQAIDNFRISLARQIIANKYRDQNFPFAHVEVPSEPLSQRGELIFDITEGPKVTIRMVDFKGALTITKDHLRDQIKTATWFPIFSAGKYDAQQVDEDVASLQRYYEDRGYFDARVGRKLIFSPDQSELEIDFLIDEGRRYTVNKVSFVGNKSLTEAQLMQDLKLTPGQPYDLELVQRDQKQIIKNYSPLGFIYQEPNAANPSSDPEYLHITHKEIYATQPGKVDEVYVISEGKPFRLGRIQAKGNYKSQDKLILREFRDTTPNTIYNSGAVQDSVDRLRGQPYFSTITVTPIGEDPHYRDLLVEVQEARTAQFNLGAGITSNGGIQGNISYTQNNFDLFNVPNDWRDIFSEHAFTGAGQQLRLEFSPGTIFSNASVSFTEPYMFDQPYLFREQLYLHDRLREHYDDRRIGDSIAFGKRFDYVWSGQITLRGEQVDIRQVDDDKYRPEEILAARGTHPLTSVAFQVRRDTTNPGLFPFKGSVTTANYELFGAMGGDSNFSKLTVSSDFYQTIRTDLLDRKTVLRFSGFAGSILGNSQFYERFYGGGNGSVRGFLYRGISPRAGRGDDPIGGDFAFSGTAELNFPIYQETLRGVVFTDVGDVERDFRVGTVRSSVGVGMRLMLPILNQAPIAIDFGIPITTGRGDDKQLVSFSLGFSQ